MGRDETDGDGASEETSDGGGPTAALGRYRARDGSAGARVALDVDRPHAGLVVGKRGSGKSYTLGVVAEGVADAAGLAPVVVDPMGVFDGLAADGGTVHERPRVRADALAPEAWPRLFGLDPAGPVGGLLWRAFAERATLDGARSFVAGSDAERATRRAAANHVDLAASWDAFDPDGLTAADLAGGEPTVLDCSALSEAATNAVCRAVAAGLYDAGVRGTLDRLPWLFVDEAHALFEGVAGPALRTLLTRGRAPGVSLVCATQRPSALPDVAVSQADLLVAHRLTARADIAALDDARPTFLDDEFGSRLPDGVGEALVVDDATESVHPLAVRERRTHHGGASPRASGVAASTGRGDEVESDE
nr:ATP-binding protein [Candidatus Halobonum tyrrellensis]